MFSAKAGGCELSNSFAGVTSDVGKIRETMDAESHPALLLVDGVSSIGGLNFEFDKWKVDVAVTGSQKALSLPTGLGVLAVSDKASFRILLDAFYLVIRKDERRNTGWCIKC